MDASGVKKSLSLVSQTLFFAFRGDVCLRQGRQFDAAAGATDLQDVATLSQRMPYFSPLA